MGNWTKRENNTVGKWLADAGYYSAFLGKYINGLEYNAPPFGWNHWGGFQQTYDFYNASQWVYDFDETRTKIVNASTKIHNGVH